MPRLLGISGRPEQLEGRMLKPMENYGLKVMSMGFLVEEDTPMIWRGPMVMSALNQMLREVAWGELDVLVVDMPPGTGDAQLTMAQNVPLAGAVIVSTPQDLALIDARKGLNMFRKVERAGARHRREHELRSSAPIAAAGMTSSDMAAPVTRPRGSVRRSWERSRCRCRSAKPLTRAARWWRPRRTGRTPRFTWKSRPRCVPAWTNSRAQADAPCPTSCSSRTGSGTPAEVCKHRKQRLVEPVGLRFVL
jgi:hypothetical protein